MYFPDNRRTVKNQARLSFTCPRANVSFSVVIEFVAQGAKLDSPQAPLPAGVQFRDEMGDPMTPGDGHVVPKGHNSCSVDVLGVNYELFSVQLVDEASGGTLYFHAEAAIPPELNGKGILEDNPYRNLE